MHNIKKNKIKRGKGATGNLLRGMIRSFIISGKIETTVSRAKTLKSMIDRLSYKAKRGNEADKNVLLKHLGGMQYVDNLSKIVTSTFDKETGGFIKIIKIGKRQGDNAEIARIEWSKTPAYILERDSKKKDKTKEKKTEEKEKKDEKEKKQEKNIKNK